MKKLTILLAAALGFSLSAAVKLPAIFSDHAVLAKRAKVPVFGSAAPGEKVTVEFNKQTRSAVAGKDGKWRVDLDLANSPEGPFELKVNNIVIKDVIVGEVWLCSGQSNMAFKLEKCEGFAAIKAKPAGSRLRTFNVWARSAKNPIEGGAGRWVYADSQNVANFSGTALLCATLPGNRRRLRNFSFHSATAPEVLHDTGNRLRTAQDGQP